MDETAEIVSAFVLLAPITFNIVARYASLHGDPELTPKSWLQSRLIARPIRFLAVIFWCACWDLFHRSVFVESPLELLAFWILPLLSVAVSQWIACQTSKSVLHLKWNSFDVTALVFWSTVSQTGALLLMAVAAGLLYKGWWQGFLLLPATGVVTLVGTAKLRSSEGLRFRTLRSGRLHGRAFQLARKMSVPLKRVSIVPAGKGHLTNAYGLSQSIALTDNYGDFASGPQLDFVIGHELTHVGRKHALKELGVAAALYFSLGMLFFRLPPSAWQLRPAVDLLFLAAPAFFFWFVSRRFEYAADRESVKFTDHPQAAIRSLADLQQTTGVPAKYGRITELFETHPCLYRRAVAIARVGKMPLDRVHEILSLPELGKNRCVPR